MKLFSYQTHLATNNQVSLWEYNKIDIFDEEENKQQVFLMRIVSQIQQTKQNHQK